MNKKFKLYKKICKNAFGKETVIVVKPKKLKGYVKGHTRIGLGLRGEKHE